MILYYHLGKANMVVNSLNRLSIESLAHVDKEKGKLVKDIHHLANLGVCLLDFEEGAVFMQEVARSYLGAKIKERQMLDPALMRIKGDVGG